MRIEQLTRCDDRSFKDRLFEIGLSLNDKRESKGPIGTNDFSVDIPFASSYFEIDPNGHLAKIFNTALFRRQENISQLQFLVHESRLKSCDGGPELFTHQQSEHAKLAACLGVAILLRYSVNLEEALRFAVAVAYHDAAAPVGRDTVIRLNRNELCEEKNFSKVMHEAGMEELFAYFSFGIKEAQFIIYGHGLHGKLLDFVDKLSYTLLDAHYGLAKGFLIGATEACVCNNPFFGNVWLDVILTKKGLGFLHARRLYYFLLIRALMHDNFYRNPACRKLEVVYASAILDGLKRGFISYENLLHHDDRFLEMIYDHSLLVRKAKKIRYRSFREGCKALGFINLLGNRLVHMEEVASFRTGLNWLVKKGDAFRSLQDVVHSRQVANLEILAQHRQGWHLYFV